MREDQQIAKMFAERLAGKASTELPKQPPVLIGERMLVRVGRPTHDAWWQPKLAVRVRLRYGVYPGPCAGRTRLERLGLDEWDGLNLLEPSPMPSAWDTKQARLAWSLIEPSLDGKIVITLGARVVKAAGLIFKPLERAGKITLMLPHPSGLCRWWSEKGNFEAAKAAVRALLEA